MNTGKLCGQFGSTARHGVADLADAVECRPVWENLLEPAALVFAYLEEPPAGFEPLLLGAAAATVPAFVTDYDPLMTLDEPLRKLAGAIPFLRRVLKLRTLFVGTTIAEYCLYPKDHSPLQLLSQVRTAMRDRGTSAVIIKDLPQESPLLDESANQCADRCVDTLEAHGFVTVSGQALAYVPIDFATMDDYFRRLSRTRRKSIRRKLRDTGALEITSYASGDPWFGELGVIHRLYRLYLNVYERSDYQFDLLSERYFRETLLRREHGGVVFVYRHAGKIIGFNLCYIHNNNLVDKYVGFEYPAARQHNLYYVSWFHNLAYAHENHHDTFIAGCSSPEIKAFLGARFTPTRHAIYLVNPLLRGLLRRFRSRFEPDADWMRTHSASIDRSP